MSKHRDNPDWLDELYESSSQETPPPALDAELRAKARGAGVVTPLKRPWFRRPALLGGLATAATLVLGVSIGLSSLTREATPAPASAPAMLLELEDARSPSPRPAPRATVNTDSAATAEELAEAQARIEEVMVAASFSGAAAANAQAAAGDQPAETDQEPDALSRELGTSTDDERRQLAGDVARRGSNETRTEANNAAEKLTLGAELAAQLRASEGLAVSSFASRTAAAPPLDPASATKLLLPTLDPTECTTLAFIDVQSDTPYALCNSTTLLELHHADCDVPYVLRPAAIVTSATPGWLAISDGDEQLRLRCGPGGWLPSADGATSGAERPASEDEPDP